MHVDYFIQYGGVLVNLLSRELPYTQGPVIIYGGGWHRREMFFLAKYLLTQQLKRQKFDYPTSNIN
jgi:hypothetical protein